MMVSSSMIFRVALVATAIVASGYLQGRLTRRWGSPQELKTAGRRLVRAPEKFGPWKVQETIDLDDQTKQILECEGYVYNRYINEKTKEVVTAIVLLGPTGPIAVHTPEVCYAHRDYMIDEKRKKVDIESTDGSQHRFWALTLTSRGVDAHKLRVYYGWGIGGQWEASTHPRLEYAFRPFLYKIQAVGHLAPGANQDATSQDPTRDFLMHATATMKRYFAK